jgi:hypothetical protein
MPKGKAGSNEVWRDEPDRAKRGEWAQILRDSLPPEAEVQDPKLLDRVLAGDLEAKMEDSVCVMRSYLATTFTESANERNLFQEDVYPFIKEYARKMGVDFNNTEMRFGITKETTDDHQSNRLTLSEIERCRADSAGLTFVILLGDKYGYRPLQSVVDGEEYEEMKAKIDDERPQFSKTMEEWFKLDENTGTYVLQSAADVSDWVEIEEKITKAFRRASLALPADLQMQYRRSVVEGEAEAGLFKESLRHRAVNCFFFDRQMQVDRATHPAIKHFQDREWDDQTGTIHCTHCTHTVLYSYSVLILCTHTILHTILQSNRLRGERRRGDRNDKGVEAAAGGGASTRSYTETGRQGRV